MNFYIEDNVFQAALKRIRYIFEKCENVFVASSGGKDSIVTMEMAVKVAKEMGRLPVKVAFWDQESEYEATVDYFRKIRNRPEIQLYWFQVPFSLGANLTCGDSIYLHAWHPDEEDKWMRKREPDSIHDFGEFSDGPGMRFHAGTDRMGEFIFGKDSHYMVMLGIRADESLVRRGLMFKPNVVWGDITWASRVENAKNGFKCYPLYDWKTSDIWKAISENRWTYNRAYDLMFRIGMKPGSMRVSSLIHETAVHELKILQQIEPQTWEKLVNRVYGVNTFKHMMNQDAYRVTKVPPFFASWNEYRDYLMDKICTPEARAVFQKAFLPHKDTDNVYILRAQVNTILMNDVNLTKYNNALQTVRMKQKFRRKSNVAQG